MNNHYLRQYALCLIAQHHIKDTKVCKAIDLYLDGKISKIEYINKISGTYIPSPRLNRIAQLLYRPHQRLINDISDIRQDIRQDIYHKPLILTYTDDNCPKCHGTGNRRKSNKRRPCVYCHGTGKHCPILTHNNYIIPTIARTIYETQDYSPMPILGDALIDAGYTNQEAIKHCSTTTHYKGCWLIDNILGHRPMQYNLTNNPEIPIHGSQPYEISQEDIIEDIGDAVHVKCPTTGTTWRFYYIITNDTKLIDKRGVIQL